VERHRAVCQYGIREFAPPPGRKHDWVLVLETPGELPSGFAGSQASARSPDRRRRAFGGGLGLGTVPTGAYLTGVYWLRVMEGECGPGASSGIQNHALALAI